MNRTEDGLVGDVDFEAVSRGRGGDHPRARRRRPDDDRDAARQHARGRSQPARLSKPALRVDIRPVRRIRGLACGAHERLERAGSGARFRPIRGRKSFSSAESHPETRSHPTRGGSMDFTRLSQGEKIAGVSGILLILIMFIFELVRRSRSTRGRDRSRSSAPRARRQRVGLVRLHRHRPVHHGARRDRPGRAGRIARARSACPVAASAVVAGPRHPVGGPGRHQHHQPAGLRRGPLGAGIAHTRKIGVFLGLIAAAAVAVGGYMAMQEEGTSFSDEAGRFGGGGDAGTGAPPPPPPPSNPPPSNPPPSNPPPSA